MFLVFLSGLADNVGANAPWIGFTDRVVENKFVWLDGANAGVSFK